MGIQIKTGQRARWAPGLMRGEKLPTVAEDQPGNDGKKNKPLKHQENRKNQTRSDSGKEEHEMTSRAGTKGAKRNFKKTGTVPTQMITPELRELQLKAQLPNELINSVAPTLSNIQQLATTIDL